MRGPGTNKYVMYRYGRPVWGASGGGFLGVEKPLLVLGQGLGVLGWVGVGLHPVWRGVSPPWLGLARLVGGSPTSMSRVSRVGYVGVWDGGGF